MQKLNGDHPIEHNPEDYEELSTLSWLVSLVKAIGTAILSLFSQEMAEYSKCYWLEVQTWTRLKNSDNPTTSKVDSQREDILSNSSSTHSHPDLFKTKPSPPQKNAQEAAGEITHTYFSSEDPQLVMEQLEALPRFFRSAYLIDGNILGIIVNYQSRIHDMVSLIHSFTSKYDKILSGFDQALEFVAIGENDESLEYKNLAVDSAHEWINKAESFSSQLNQLAMQTLETLWQTVPEDPNHIDLLKKIAAFNSDAIRNAAGVVANIRSKIQKFCDDFGSIELQNANIYEVIEISRNQWNTFHDDLTSLLAATNIAKECVDGLLRDLPSFDENFSIEEISTEIDDLFAKIIRR